MKKHNKNAKLICPNCYKSMKIVLVDDGYKVCAYCGMVVCKIPYTFEQINAPGFINLNEKDKVVKKKLGSSKHHSLMKIKNFINIYKN